MSIGKSLFFVSLVLAAVLCNALARNPRSRISDINEKCAAQRHATVDDLIRPTSFASSLPVPCFRFSSNKDDCWSKAQCIFSEQDNTCKLDVTQVLSVSGTECATVFGGLNGLSVVQDFLKSGYVTLKELAAFGANLQPCDVIRSVQAKYSRSSVGQIRKCIVVSEGELLTTPCPDVIFRAPNRSFELRQAPLMQLPAITSSMYSLNVTAARIPRVTGGLVSSLQHVPVVGLTL